MIDNGRDFSQIVEAAHTHYVNLKQDIDNAFTRIEHLRITRLALEAENLYLQILSFNEHGERS